MFTFSSLDNSSSKSILGVLDDLFVISEDHGPWCQKQQRDQVDRDKKVFVNQ